MDRIDLNLLVVFDALIRERSVTGAARRLGLGQPATSAALNRLRNLLDDPLFVRLPRGVEPTVRAQELAEPVAQAIDQLRRALGQAEPFAAATAKRVFTLAGADYLGLVLLPSLMTALRQRAPFVDLRYRFVDKDYLVRSLDSGEIELAVAVLPEVPRSMSTERLITDTFICATGVQHPSVQQGLTLQAYAAYPHVLVTQKSDAVGAVDQALNDMGLERRVALTVPQVSLIPALLEGSDLIATIGRRAAIQLARTMPMRLHRPPLALPSWQLDVIWARRSDSDRGLVWLREQLRQTVRDVEAQPLPRHVGAM